MSETTGPTPRTSLRRQPERGSHDRHEIERVLDEGLVAHVGIVVQGEPVVIPMAYGRDGDRLVLHGSVASRLMRTMSGGVPVCVTVTLLDGLVMARSAFHHSMNYRSVVVMGVARRITDPVDAAAALDALVEHVVPGRSGEARPASATELRQTTVLELPIVEASLKRRTGGAHDEPDDLTSRAWAGVVPLTLRAGDPVANDDLAPGIPTSPAVRELVRRRNVLG